MLWLFHDPTAASRVSRLSAALTCLPVELTHLPRCSSEGLITFKLFQVSTLLKILLPLIILTNSCEFYMPVIYIDVIILCFILTISSYTWGACLQCEVAFQKGSETSQPPHGSIWDIPAYRPSTCLPLCLCLNLQTSLSSQCLIRTNFQACYYFVSY